MPAVQTRRAARNAYSVHPSVAMVQNWVNTLKEKTGKSLEEWLELVKQSGPPTEAERRVWLKDKHGLGTNSAWWMAEIAEGKDTWDGDPESYLKMAPKYVEDMYAGKKAALRPIYDRLLQLGLKLGKDIKACPCKTMVPLYRNHVFAEIKPTTLTRIDLGLALAKAKGKLPKRLIDTGGLAKKDRITHRIPITSLAEIDEDVTHWLKVAYDLDA